MELIIAYYGRWLNDDESMTSSRNKSSMLRGSEEKECPYFRSNVLEVLNKLLVKGLVELLESKHPKKVRRTNNPRYSKYHRIVNHPIKKCKAFKKQVQQVAKEGKGTLDEEYTEEFDSSIKIILESTLEEE